MKGVDASKSWGQNNIPMATSANTPGHVNDNMREACLDNLQQIPTLGIQMYVQIHVRWALYTPTSVYVLMSALKARRAALAGCCCRRPLISPPSLPSYFWMF